MITKYQTDKWSDSGHELNTKAKIASGNSWLFDRIYIEINT